jgi:hypothetical protein
MAKTKPIGVRFDENMLEVFKEDGIADSPQKALNFLHSFYLENRKDKTDFTELFSKSKLFKNRSLQVNNVFIDKDGKETKKPAGEPITVTITNKNQFKPQNKTDSGVKKEIATETMPEIDNSLILKQIEFVKNEVKPAFIDKSKFERYQEKKIAELKAKLK